jgi:hypothetical protein
VLDTPGVILHSISIAFQHFFNLNLPSGISRPLGVAWFSIPLPLFYAIYFTIRVPGAGDAGCSWQLRPGCVKIRVREKILKEDLTNDYPIIILF